ncbi:hypothetical protein MKZ38_008225 [Zalerion maritima]|uniref:DNA ligase n=1 Tax=Zalerion maritima TaxID=339359 RepID=A0AAD5RGY1_9PEZI|nr:hypothetical protein MKZ38_008225 [Zalerion maritima]
MSRKRQKHDPAAVEEDEKQYGSIQELDEKYPERPKNHSKTLLFSELIQHLFNPLNENKKPAGGARGRGGRHRPSKISPHEQRRQIIERFIAHWRDQVGDDIYPAFRLIMPDKDRDRAVYGLKEYAIGKLLVKLMKIDKNSEDGFALLKFKLPGATSASRMAGDFAGRCFEVLTKRQMRSEPGDMTIAEVNELLDQLAAASGEKEILPILDEFYVSMNGEELMWLIRIILKQMKVGATERTFLDIWHPDAEALFNVSSSLRRVCWDLHDPTARIDGDKTSVTLMDCFQPQLAQFQVNTSNFQKLVDKLRPTEEDAEYWIEEKLDGERMQMHMVSEPSVPGGRKFVFWSRKGKDYTYLYGEGLEDDNSALTRHLEGAFVDGVHSIILDGEMITWDPELDKIMAFGTLKTAALAEQKNPVKTNGPRPLFKVFDILYLNGKDLTHYDLRTRRAALTKAVPGARRRLEVHEHEVATSPEAITPLLRKVVAESSEGLVLKNPRSMYRLNSRNDDWLKVKPDYMSEFGESLDCVVVGGYYGSGRRGGTISSFMCGLRAGENHRAAGAGREKCYSFFKVGGGFSVEHYAEIRHHTEGKWQDWHVSHPPTEYIELGGGSLQYEHPDVWIRPSESVVLEVKAASVSTSDQFAMGFTLRFPRFRRIRLDKAWDQALDVDEFAQLRKDLEAQQAEKKMNIEERRKRPAKRAKRDIVMAGTEGADAPTPLSTTTSVEKPNNKIFSGIEFCVLSDAAKPRQTKAQLENLIKAHGGKIGQRSNIPAVVLVADKKVVKVASIMKSSERNIVKPRWILDCIAQNERRGHLLPYEPVHLFHGSEEQKELAKMYTDPWGDSYNRDLDVGELKGVLDEMAVLKNEDPKAERELFLDQLEERGRSLGRYKAVLFRRCKVFLALGEGVYENSVEPLKTRNYVIFGGGKVGDDVMDEEVTHVVVFARGEEKEKETAKKMRGATCMRRELPRIVNWKWVGECFQEGTLLDEDGFKA